MKKKIQLKQSLLVALVIGLLTSFNYAAFSIDCNITAVGELEMNCNADGSYDICVDLEGINGVFEVIDHSSTALNIPGNFTIPLNGPFTQTVCLTYPNYNIYNFCISGLTEANSGEPCDITLDFIGPGMCCEVDCDDGDCTNGLETWDAASCSCVNNPPPVINTSSPQTTCNADGSYKVCINMAGYGGNFEVVDHTNAAISSPGSFTLPSNGSYNQSLCLFYPNNYIYNFCIREVVNTASGPCYITVDFIGAGMCCEVNCDDGFCGNGFEIWDPASCSCIVSDVAPPCSGSEELSCDDGDPCTENDVEFYDSCHEVICLPCAGTAIASCTLQDVPSSCDDGNPCTENDSEVLDLCSGEVCVPCAGIPVPSCTLQDAPLACDDYNPCTENDVEVLDLCTGAVCVPCAGTLIPACTLQDAPIVCDDNNPCTENDVEVLDSCTGAVCVPCTGTPIPACTGSTTVVACNDNNDCTSNDVQIINDCDGTICEPCIGFPSCDGDYTPPQITLNWGTGINNGDQLSMFCDDVTYFDESYVSLNDNCDDAPTVTFTDEFIEYGDCNTTGYLSKWRCYWTAIDECGNEAVFELFVTLICSPCDDYNICTLDTYDGCDCVHEPIPDCGVYNASHCTYPPTFYGNLNNSYGGQSCGSVVNNCLNDGPISLGLYGQSISIFSTDCVGALLPSYGGIGQLAQGNTIYSGNCSYTPPLANALAAHLLTLKLNIRNNPNLAYISINDQIGCLLAPQSVLQQCGGDYTIGQLSTIADYALGGYYGTDQNLFNDIYIALCLVNDGFAFCADPCIYVREQLDEILPIKNNDEKDTGIDDTVENINIEIIQQVNYNDLQIAINYNNIQITLELIQNVNNGSLSLIQLDGKVLVNKSFTGIKGRNLVSIDRNNLPPGMYYIVAQTEQNQIYVKKMINH